MQFDQLLIIITDAPSLDNPLQLKYMLLLLTPDVMTVTDVELKSPLACNFGILVASCPGVGPSHAGRARSNGNGLEWSLVYFRQSIRPRLSPSNMCGF